MSGLPSGWAEAAISDVLSHTIGGVWGHESGDSEVDVDVIRVTEMDPLGNVSPATAARRSITLRQLETRQLIRGDLVLEKSGGGPNRPVGRVGMVPVTSGPAVCANFMQLLRPDPSTVVPEYLEWLLRFLHLAGRTEQLQTASTNIRNLKTKDYLRLPIPVPPLQEQERIIEVIGVHLTRLAATIEALRNSQTRLRVLRTRILEAAFEELNDRKPVADVAEVRGGIQKQPKRRPSNNPAPFLRVANVLRGSLDLEEVHEIELFDGDLDKYRLEAGDLLVVEGNGSPGQIGRSACWKGEVEDCVHQNHLIRVRPGPDLEPAFLDLFWNSPSNAQQLTEVASSTSGLYTLSTTKVKRVEVPIAPLDLQRRVVDQLEQQLDVIDRLDGSLEATVRRGESLRLAVLSAAFSGQLVPQNPSDEPVSELLDRIQAKKPAKPQSRKKVSS